jgi:hypothetical protein
MPNLKLQLNINLRTPIVGSPPPEPLIPPVIGSYVGNIIYNVDIFENNLIISNIEILMGESVGGINYGINLTPTSTIALLDENELILMDNNNNKLEG